MHAYPRTLKLKEIDKYLQKSKNKYPKLLKNKFNYTYEEHINSTKNINELSKEEIMNNVIKYIIGVSQIKIKIKNIKLTNNSEFLKFNIDNLKEVLIKRNLMDINIYIKELDNLYQELHNNRKLYFIHGELHKKNMIINNNDFYIIDCELATYGDIAYEIATHFILMEYNEEEQTIFIDKISKKLQINKNELEKDIMVYISFEKCRRKILQKSTKKG